MAVNTAQVQQAYVAFFNRPADLAGLNYWTSSPAASVANLLDAFSKTPEYTSLYSNMNSTQLVLMPTSSAASRLYDVASMALPCKVRAKKYHSAITTSAHFPASGNAFA